MIGDMTFVCGTRLVARLVSTYGRKPSHVYHFNYSAGTAPVLHGSELPFVFGQAQGKRAPETNVALSRRMGKMWASLAAGDGAAWGPNDYANATDVDVVLETVEDGAAFPLETGRRAAFCDFWETYYLTVPLGENGASFSM